MAAGNGPTTDELSLAERVCLALIDNGFEHGWAIGTALAADGEFGRIWTLSRPLTYRAIDQLDERGLVSRRDQKKGGRRERTILRCTASGRRLARRWVDEPVAHLRDVRTELLLKLAIRQRRGTDNAPLLLAQREAFRSHFEVLMTADTQADVVDVWRRESARAVRRFLDAAYAQATGGSADAPHQPQLRLSARNQLRSRITEITHGEVTSLVRCRLPDGQRITSVVTTDSLVELDLAADDEVIAVIKSSEVMLAPVEGLGP